MVREPMIRSLVSIVLVGLVCPVAGAGGDVDGRPASRLLTAGTIGQLVYLKAADTDPGDAFGAAVAVSGDTLVVGVPSEDSGATGVDGDATDESAADAGAAYVFVRDGGAWVQQAYLKASNTDAGDQFGFSVAVSGDTVVVGAPGEDSGAVGVDGDASDDGAGDAGAAYVFVRVGGAWSQQAYLKASNTDADDEFGWSVEVAGDTVLVSAPHEASGAAGVGGDESDDGAANAGAAYVFTRSGTAWNQQAYLKASNTDAGDHFGWAADLAADTAVISAPYESSGATGVGGDETDDSAGLAGAAYVFTRSGTTWSQQAYLKATNTEVGDRFGWSASVSGDTVVVGARSESSSATGVDGDDADNGAAESGAAFVFARSGTTWSPQAYLKASNTGMGDWFGWWVSVSGDTAVVGAPLEASAATGVDGAQGDDSAAGAGAVYVFARDGAAWSQAAYLKASNTADGDLFGIAVEVAGDTLVVGASGEDSDATGVNGDQGSDFAVNAGAAYAFTLASPWEDLGFALAGVYGDPLLVGSGTLIGGERMSITLGNALETTPAFLFLGLTELDFSPFYGGTLVPDFTVPPGQIIVTFTDGLGEVTLGTTWPAAIPSGFEMYLHFWIADAAGPYGFAASNALKGTSP